MRRGDRVEQSRKKGRCILSRTAYNSSSVAYTRVHVYISGRVQGVNFRAATREQARAHGVCGWVRNLDDGRVEAIFEGDRSAVQHVVSWCYRGPAFAHVEHVDVQWEQPTGQEQSFSIVW